MIGVPAAHGRSLLPDDDRPGAAPVVVISAGLWSDMFAQDPGAVGQEPPTPYVHFAASQSRGNLLPAPVPLARTESDAGALGAAMQRELRTIDPDVVFLEGLTLRDNTAAQLLPARLLAAMLGAAGLVAVWLAAIGLYGVIVCAIVRRTQEIGIRMALGATFPRRGRPRRPARDRSPRRHARVCGCRRRRSP